MPLTVHADSNLTHSRALAPGATLDSSEGCECCLMFEDTLLAFLWVLCWIPGAWLRPGQRHALNRHIDLTEVIPVRTCTACVCIVSGLSGLYKYAGTELIVSLICAVRTLVLDSSGWRAAFKWGHTS